MTRSETEMRKRAVVLLSGGIDSATALYIARRRGYECYPLVFDYGQRHRREVESAKRIAAGAGLGYTVLKIALPWKGSSLLAGGAGPAGVRRRGKRGIPPTYVPSRNTIFLSYAASFAEAIGARKIFIGANCVDFPGYPDCRGGYLKAFGRVLKEGTKAGVEGRRISVDAPLLFKSKAEIIKKGARLGVPYRDTWSCYEGKRAPCGACDSCAVRARGFGEAGMKDPLTHSGRRKA